MANGRVYQRGRNKKTSSWSFVVDVATGNDGKRKQLSRGGFRTKAEAQAALDEVRRQARTGTYVEPTTRTISAFLRYEWLPARRSSIRPSTYDSYDTNIRLHVEPHIGGLSLQKLTTSHLNTLYATLLAPKEQGGAALSPKTVHYIHTIIHRALGDAMKWNYVVRNVAASADPPNQRAQHREQTVWTAEQARAFLAAVDDDRLYALWHLAVSTGMRRGELVGLRWTDIDFDAKQLSVRQAVIAVRYEVQTSSPKTAKGRRVIALDDATLAVLREHKRRQAEERIALGPRYADAGLVFPQADGSVMHPESVSDRFEKLVLTAGVPRIRLHDVRHTHATLALRAGVHPKIVSERLGHSSISTTLDVYSHALPSMQAEAAELVARLVSGVS